MASDSAHAHLLQHADPEQRRLMDERVILVDENDRVIGSESKANAHLVSTGLPLHRAFSVLLFNAHNELLLQRRAHTKLTFPGYWTNTCCSHPLYDIFEETETGGDPARGVKVAAVRKLEHELGIPEGTIRTEEFTYMGRIHYKAVTDGGVWGEHEIDYILLVEKELQEGSELKPEPNEVEEIKYVSMVQLKEMFEKEKEGKEEVKLTPWFKHIMNEFGFKWWQALGTPGLAQMGDHETIYRMGECKQL